MKIFFFFLISNNVSFGFLNSKKTEVIDFLKTYQVYNQFSKKKENLSFDFINYIDSFFIAIYSSSFLSMNETFTFANLFGL